jgi:hypothetical protein
MPLKDLPEWAKKGNSDDPLEIEVRKILDGISAAIAGTSNKSFTVEAAGERLLISMHRKPDDEEESTETLFTLCPVDNDEYLLMEAESKPSDLPMFVGPLAETLAHMRHEVLYTLENWERPEEAEPVAEEDDDVPGMSAEDWAAIERLINPSKDGQPPPGLN